MKIVLLVTGIIAATLLVQSCATSAPASRDVTVSLRVPDLGWRVKITEIYRVENELWVVSYVDRPPGMAGQVITTATDTVQAAAADLPEKHFIIGKTWGWKNEEPYTFLKDRGELPEKIKSARLLFQRVKP